MKWRSAFPEVAQHPAHSPAWRADHPCEGFLVLPLVRVSLLAPLTRSAQPIFRVRLIVRLRIDLAESKLRRQRVASKQAYLLLFLGIFANPSARAAQEKLQPSLVPGNAGATIKCHDQPYVSVTADAEQTFPLQVVATVNCNEEVSILSDSQGYTVKVRTASGKIGYVTRFEVVTDPSKKEVAARKATLDEANANSSDIQVQGEGAGLISGESRPDERGKGSFKPRIYVSDTASWMASGGFGNPSSVAPGNLYGGYNPEMVDIYQDFTSDCAAAVVTQEKSKADYAVLFDRQSSKKGLTGLGGLVKVNKVKVLSKSGDTLLSQTSHSIDTAVKIVCSAISQRSGTTNP